MVRNLELVKWLGLAGMLADHVNLFVLGAAFPVAEHLGALALPLFAAALAQGVAGMSLERRWRLVGRLAAWGVVAQLAWMLLRDSAVLNVLFTLGAGVACATARRDPVLEAWGRRWLVIGLALAVGVFAEFSIVGVLLVWALVELVAERSGAALVVLAGCALMLPVFNSGSYAAIAAVGVVAVCNLAPRDLPRIRRFFYVAYAGHLPLLWLAVQGAR